MIVKRLNEATLKDEAEAKLEKAADTINANDIISDDEGDIEKTLNRLLATNKRIVKSDGDEFQNVLLIGEAGIGKTARVRAWARKNGVNLYEVRASGMDETDLGGAISPSDDKKTINRLASTEFDVLDRPNSVLFLDEFNRAQGNVRTQLLELINSHVVPDPREPSGQRKLKNFLFTVAAINPADFGYNTDDLDIAEKSRFMRKEVVADKANLKNYLTRHYDNEIAKNQDDPEYIKELMGKKKLAETILSSKEIQFDDKKDLEQLHQYDSPFNPRSFTRLLEYSDGTKDDLIDNWDDFCNPAKKEKVKLILANYADVDDKATQVLQNHETESEVFGKSTSLADKMLNKLGL